MKISYSCTDAAGTEVSADDVSTGHPRSGVSGDSNIASSMEFWGHEPQFPAWQLSKASPEFEGRGPKEGA
jgi:hypothetical protein